LPLKVLKVTLPVRVISYTPKPLNVIEAEEVTELMLTPASAVEPIRVP